MNKLKYRCAIITENGEIKSKNCETRDEVDQFILENNAKRFRILDKELRRVIETDEGIIVKEEK